MLLGEDMRDAVAAPSEQDRKQDDDSRSPARETPWPPIGFALLKDVGQWALPN